MISIPNDRLVQLLAFLGASLAVLASSDAVHPYARVTSAAVAAGCGAVLALLRSPGQPVPPLPPMTREERVQAVRDAAPDRVREVGRG